MSEIKAKDMVNYPVTDGIPLDRETLVKHMPKGFSGKITDEILTMLNNVENDTGMSKELFSEQLYSYTHLLTGGVGIETLSNAIKFVNLRMLPKMGAAKAFSIVFPEKAKEIEDRGATVDSFASMYAGTKTVVAVQKLILVPVYISHAPIHNAMLKKLFDLSNGIGAKADDRVSPTVQMNAAIALRDATKMPEDNSVTLKIGMTDDATKIQQGLFEQLAMNSELQLAALRSGRSIGEIQRIGVSTDKILEAEIE